MKVIYDKNTLEFTTVALEYLAWLEKAGPDGMSQFVNHAVKLLPLLYFRATLLPDTDIRDAVEFDSPACISEITYNNICSRVAGIMGENDDYLETFHPDMQYSDTPIISHISENLADIYQALGDFTGVFRDSDEETMLLSLQRCIENFRLYWGQDCLNALKALHAVYCRDDYSDEY
ncbi:MAG: DUF5063 domain-containing protein [Tannerella sp.]|jgi:hypothetical protein|nr:DUF5063 domain-containing protein [Tannerella sp.]